MKANSKTIIANFIGHFFMICLVLSVLAKPVAFICNQLSEAEHELFEDSKKGEQSENEQNIDFEQEEAALDLLIFNTFLLDVYSVHNFFKQPENILNFKLSIHSPPPEMNYLLF
ncbi:hypothetical protein GGR42_002999 [Saonia flava]|uniref:Uncharacterized protein n=1 Tax=Saonia flava TaxID=523696 RepID=A0A846QX25_9FLAO|nr:hypothetical protein [Saonia flava]NJB72508.1 hypothetical protein [Saonia flava]